MTRSPFLDLAHRIVMAWQAHREARRRRERWSLLCRADKRLKGASEKLSRHRKSHRPVKADLAEIKAVMTERLRGEVRHG